MGAVDRVARAAVVAAARRWPDDLASLMRDEWLAELAAIDGPRRSVRKLAFAGSLAVSPGVDEPSWRERTDDVGRLAVGAAGVTVVAAVATNLARGSSALAPVMLLLAAAGLAVIGRRVWGSVALVGVALFAFLFAGNPVPVMPFMGAADIAPAVATWVVGMALTLRVARPTGRRWAAAATGRRWAGAAGGRPWVAVVGGLVTLDLATIAGSAHAAAVLGVPAWTAPAWFPLALLPGDVVAFGPYFGGGTAMVGGLAASGPAFHASDILLANAAVSAGPLLLCAAFLLGPALNASLTAPTRTNPSRRETAAPEVAVAVTARLRIARRYVSSRFDWHAAARRDVSSRRQAERRMTGEVTAQLGAGWQLGSAWAGGEWWSGRWRQSPLWPWRQCCRRRVGMLMLCGGD